MAAHRIGETGLSESGPSTSSHHVPYGILHGINSPVSSLINQGSGFDFGGLEEAIVLQGVKIRNDESKASLFTGKPAATLEMFPSWPMRFQHTPRGGSKSGGESTDSGSGLNTISSRTEAQFEPESPLSKKASSTDYQAFDQQQKQQLQQLEQEMASDASRYQTQKQNQSAAKPFQEKRKGVGSTSEKQLDAKTLRRLAQNREAARKSRLRKKAYVQQLESSRLKLSQLEQELHRVRSQGLLVGCGAGAGAGAGANMSSGAAIFDMEYGRWLEDDQRHMEELRRSLEAGVSDNELRVMVEGYLSHYDEIFQLKGVAAKSDVFHLINGLWTTPAERCFLWIAGFRPSDLIAMVIQQLEPLAEQQIMGMYGLRQSSQQAEEALSQGLDQFQNSLLHTIVGGLTVDGVQQMLLAMTKLSNLEAFVRQADNLRQQTLHQLCRLLTVRQAARCFLVIAEYYDRLRALSSFWASRSRGTLINDENSCHQITTNMPIVQSSQDHFSSF